MAGIVCVKSSRGRTAALARCDLAVQMPSGTPTTNAITVETMTSAKLFIAGSHSSSESMSAKPAKESTPAVSPRSQNARTASIPASSSGSGAVSTALTPSYMPFEHVAMKSKSQERLVWSQSTMESTQSPR